jgi:hypothetical protein
MDEAESPCQQHQFPVLLLSVRGGPNRWNTLRIVRHEDRWNAMEGLSLYVRYVLLLFIVRVFGET